VQAANQKEARSFVETATYSWTTELVLTNSSGWGGTNAACPKRLREKLPVPMLKRKERHVVSSAAVIRVVTQRFSPTEDRCVTTLITAAKETKRHEDIRVLR